MSEKLYKASDVIGVLLNVCSDDDYLKATDWLSKIPSAVIRCKDCVHWDKSNLLPPRCVVFDWFSKKNDYCSFAERRSE